MESLQRQIEDMKTRFAVQYSYLSIDEIESIYKIALGNYLSLSFPFNKSITQIPDSHARDLWWVEARMQELLERNGCTSAVSYSENGLSIKFDSSFISPELRSFLVSKAGIPK